MKLTKLKDIVMDPAPRDEENLDDLMGSMKEVGLIEPIILDQSGRVVSGRRRLSAAKKLGWTEIPAIKLTLSTLDEELARIDANLMTLPLGEVEFDMALARRKELYEQKHPETRAGVAGGTESEAEAFTTATAGLLGVSRRAVERAVARTKASPEVMAARREGLAATKVDELVRFSPDVQARLLPLAKVTPIGEFREMMKRAKVEGPEAVMHTHPPRPVEAPALAEVITRARALRGALESVLGGDLSDIEPSEFAQARPVLGELMSALNQFLERYTVEVLLEQQTA